MAKTAKEDLDNIKIEEPFYPGSMVASPGEIKRHHDSFMKYMKDMDKEAAYSISLCTHSAYMVEAYLNLMLAIFVKPEVKEEKAIYKETIRRGWRKKLKRIHLDCRHISKADLTNSIVRDLGQVFDLRNKIAHSYPHKDDLIVERMFFYKNFPILRNPVPFDTFQVAANNRLPTRSQAKNCYDKAQKMVDYLSSLIEDKARANFEIFADSNPIGFNETVGVYSVPFGKMASKVFSPNK